MSAGWDLTRAVTGEVPGEDLRFDANGLAHHAVRWGSRADRPVLLLHGNGGHAHWWDTLVPELARDHQLIALDWRGHGQTERPEPPGYALHDYERDLVGVLDALDLPPLPLIAHSMGGRAALWFAAQHPARVRGLAALDSSVGSIAPEGTAWFRDKIRGRRDGRVFDSYAEVMAAYRLVPEEPGVARDVMADVAHHAVTEREPGRWCVHFDRAVLEGDGNRDLTALATALPMPLWLGNGSQGLPHDLDLEAPHIVVRRFDGAHHFMLSDPAPVAAWLRDFLAACG